MQTVELKFNCFLLMPVIDAFPTALREARPGCCAAKTPASLAHSSQAALCLRLLLARPLACGMAIHPRQACVTAACDRRLGQDLHRAVLVDSCKPWYPAAWTAHAMG